MPTDGLWPWRPTSPCMRRSIPIQQESWFFSTGCPKGKEKPLLRLGSSSLKMNMLQMQTRPGPRSRKHSKPHSPPMTQQCKLESLLLHSTKTGRTPQDLTNTSPSSSSSQSAQESPTTTLYWNGSSEDSTHKSWYNSLSWKQLKPPRSRKVIATLHHSGEDLSHPLKEVVITTIPMLWTWITSCYPWLSKLATCVKITASYAIRKAVLLGIILVTIRVAQQVVGTTT